MERVVTAVLGGGQGARLWPLTRDRAKPAVPVGGKFRLIDIPISSSLHAGFDRIYVLTQFNSATLHRHIAQTYRFDSFRDGYVNILAAEQNLQSTDWYQGTADAVRQNLDRFTYQGTAEVLVLSGDQLYAINLKEFVARHRARQADLTIAVKPVPRADAKGLGIIGVEDDGRIVEFVEKPQDDAVLDRLALSEETLKRLGFEAEPGSLFASMGMYVFKSDVLREVLLGSDATDFGREVIPSAIHDHRVFAFGYRGYWRDIGTIKAFHQANLELARPVPPLNLYDPDYPIFTHPRFLPGTKVNHCTIHRSVICEGGIVSGERISDSVVGIRAVVREGSIIERSIVMGLSSYSTEDELPRDIPVGIGRNCVIQGAIIDTNARIGDGCRLVNERGVEEEDGDGYYIRGGIVVVPRGAEIPAGTII
ncbi:MAG: glucose-1-phosphate adenylyltransferase [Acidobacteria bacterium]|nr:glucose-1-phosphate adenylyltransferase [Acidobacteriota bacterium]